ncbi:prepilin-type N-terminal cleavage/methylation domain-containing protein [Lagierella sp.]|uniref:pilus assembly FimT family protein n=1 Tax=Lagierella sp. TaxID=2849657 RepID=UPI002639B196|nr:prepilin-type N-terminal cleavage/methylation domain-containing protein [Lagierella sp.]
MKNQAFTWISTLIKMEKSKGFTLIELLLTLFILGIVLSIGIIKFDFIKSYQESLEIRTVIVSLNEGRNSAIGTGKRTRVSIDSRENCIRIYFSIDDVQEVKLNNLDLPETASFSFTSTGAPSEAGTYTFKGARKKYIVTVEVATGKVNLSEEEI